MAWTFEFVIDADVLSSISFGPKYLIIIEQRSKLLLLLDQLKINTNLLPPLLIHAIASFLLSGFSFVFDTSQRGEVFLEHVALF